MNNKNIATSLILGAILLGGLSACKSMNMTGLSAAGNSALESMMITNEQLAAAVTASVAQMDAQNTVAPADNAYTKRLNNLTAGLTTTGTTPLNFKVYVTNEINAFACPDGSIRVYTGIMDLMTDEELLGIIGHEIGHVAMEHSLNAYKQQLLSNAALQALGSLDSRAAAVLNSTTGNIGAQLLQQGLAAKYSRTQENQADDFGYEFLKGAGRNPYAMVQAFEKMLKLEQNSQTNAQMGTYLSNMFSSHPETTERIKRMTERCKADGYIK